MAKLAPSVASDAWRADTALSTPAIKQAGKAPYLAPEGERATSHNVRFRSGAAFDPPLWRSHGEVAARSTDGGAYGATSLPLHHFASRAIPFLIATRQGGSAGSDPTPPTRLRSDPYDEGAGRGRKEGGWGKGVCV